MILLVFVALAIRALLARAAPSPAGGGTGGGSPARTDDRTSAETPVARSHVPVALAPDPRIEDWGVLGRGGMGEVHRVFDRNMRRFTALKVLDAELVGHEVARRRFMAEAQITGQLEHPNIVPVYELAVAEDGSPTHFTMKLVDGVTLTSLITRERLGARTEAELWQLLQVFLKVCDALAYAHSRGVVHRDIKPENVMIGAYGQVYVMDWGIAHVAGEPATGETPPDGTDALLLGKRAPALPVSVQIDTRDQGAIVGTYQYMAPEQAWGRNEEVDARTDVFALGGVLFHILTGRAPYMASPDVSTEDLARKGDVPHPAEVAPEHTLPPALCTIAMKALAKKREDRYCSVDALKRDVERALRSGLSLGTRSFKAGTLILREGDAPDAAYIMTRGRCEAFRVVAGERKSLREMGPGDVFGEMALLSKRPRSASVVALEDVTAIVVTEEALAREVHAESWLVPLLKTLVNRFRDLEERAGI
jgi:serine/threonine-protein kinase